MANNENYINSDITNLVLQAYYKVFNAVGYGFEKSAYVIALTKELKRLGCQFESDKTLDLIYEGEPIGTFKIDLYWASKVVVKITTQQSLNVEDLEKLRFELKHSKVQVGLLLNFGIIPEHKRKLNN